MFVLGRDARGLGWSSGGESPVGVEVENQDGEWASCCPILEGAWFIEV